MSKYSNKDILDILYYFDIAKPTDFQKYIQKKLFYKISDLVSLVSFSFHDVEFVAIFDDNIDDDVDTISKYIENNIHKTGFELLKNPKDTSTYAAPFKGKSAYLAQFISSTERLDVFLSKKYPELSRSIWQKHIKNGHVTVNEKVVISPKTEVSNDDEVEYKAQPESDYSDKKLDIIYEDDNVIVVDKPVGVLTHAKGALCDEFTVADFFKRYTTYNLNTNRPGIVHRLDRETSGIIIGAKNEDTAKSLQKQFQDRTTKKIYYAVLVGHPKHEKAVIDLPIGRNPNKPSRFRIDPNGKGSITQYEVLEKNERFSLVKLMPKTGRTHQLRVHMQYIGTPILGDTMYGRASDRLYLHAKSLEITVPSSKRMIFESRMKKPFSRIFNKEI